MLKNKFWIGFLIAVLPISYFMIVRFGIVEKSKLTAETWHSTMEIYISDTQRGKKASGLETIYRAVIKSDVRYLLDGSYIQDSKAQTFDRDNNVMISMDISNIGNWDYEQGYLFLTSDNIKNFTTGNNNISDVDKINRFKEIFLIHMLQAQRIDRVSDDMMLTTSVDNTSRLWVAK